MTIKKGGMGWVEIEDGMGINGLGADLGGRGEGILSVVLLIFFCICNSFRKSWLREKSVNLILVQNCQVLIITR